MAKSPSQLSTLLPCPLCGRTLVPVPAGESLSFRCKRGHDLVLTDLLAAQSATLTHGLEDLLAAWRCQCEKLLDTAEDAHRNGYSRVAELFERHAAVLQSRVQLLSGALPVGESASTFKVVEA